MNTGKTISTADAVRHLIVCDTQFTWAGVTNLALEQMMDLQARGWVVEGDDNNEFQLTVAGEEVVSRALQHGVPKTLADVQPGGRVRMGDQAELDRHEFQAWARELLPCPFCGNGAEFVPYKDNGLTLKCKSMGCIQRNQRTLRYGIDWLRTSMAEHWNTRALSAQPSPGGQDALAEAARRVISDIDSSDYHGEISEATYAALEAALAARQPVDSCTESECKRCRAHPDHRASLEHAGISDFRQPVTMDDALAAGDGTLHGAIDHWQERALRAEAELAARQPVVEPVAATDAMVEAALQSTVANNASPWRQVVSSEDHADFISDMRAAINAALAARPSPITAEATTTSTQTVPDHCDRIFWQHNYYQLPVGPTDHKKPTKRRQAAVETVMNLGYLWRNDAWIAPPAQALDLPYSLDADPAGIRARVCDVITGTLMVGAQGHTPPPAGHWAEPFWKAARADAGLQVKMREALWAAARSLRTIADSTKETEFLETASEIRAYANSRANCAEQALTDSQAVRNG